MSEGNVTPLPVAPEPNTLVFGREPAAWSAAAQAVVAVLAGFVFDWSTDVQGLILAVVAALLAIPTALKVRPIQVPVISAAVVAGVNLAVGFGLDLTIEQQAVLGLVVGPVLTLLFVRPQVATTATLTTGSPDLPRAA